jgi:PIN domain nuclease of toxin-antitoxin system
MPGKPSFLMNRVEVRMDFITDTHSLVWYFTEDARLSKKAIKAFEGTIKEGTVVVPAVVLAEIMYISKRGKIALSFEETLKKIEEYENFDIAPLDINILKTADRIETEMEMHDKLIVATALYYKARLITRDEQIKKAGIVSVVW